MKAIVTKYHGPAAVQGSRVSAHDGDNRVFVSWDDALSSDGNHDAAALALCRKLNWTGLLQRGHMKDNNVYVWVDDDAIVPVDKP
jgi:hypothetical protein